MPVIHARLCRIILTISKRIQQKYSKELWQELYDNDKEIHLFVKKWYRKIYIENDFMIENFKKKKSEISVKLKKSNICEKNFFEWKRKKLKIMDNMNEYDLDPELCECTR